MSCFESRVLAAAPRREHLRLCFGPGSRQFPLTLSEMYMVGKCFGSSVPPEEAALATLLPVGHKRCAYDFTYRDYHAAGNRLGLASAGLKGRLGMAGALSPCLSAEESIPRHSTRSAMTLGYVLQIGSFRRSLHHRGRDLHGKAKKLIKGDNLL